MRKTLLLASVALALPFLAVSAAMAESVPSVKGRSLCFSDGTRITYYKIGKKLRAVKNGRAAKGVLTWDRKGDVIYLFNDGQLFRTDRLWPSSKGRIGVANAYGSDSNVRFC